MPRMYLPKPAHTFRMAGYRKILLAALPMLFSSLSMPFSRVAAAADAEPKKGATAEPGPRATVAPTTGRPKQPPKKTSGDAREMFFSGQYAKALAMLKDSLNPRDLALKADIMVETGRDREAIALLSTALKTNPANALLLASRADAYLVQGAYNKALADYQAATGNMTLQPQPGQMRARLALGSLYHLLARRNGWLDQADWFFDYYDPRKNESYTAWQVYCIGAGAILGEDYKNGFAVMAMAEKKDKKLLPVFVRMGQVYHEKYEFANSSREFGKALSLNPHHPPALVGMTANLIQKRDFTGAEANAEKALTTNPRYIDAMLVMAQINFLDEQDDRAREWIQKALAVNPHHPDALIFMAAVAKIMDDENEYAAARKRLLATYASLPFVDDEEKEAARSTGLSRLYTAISQAMVVRRTENMALPWARKAAAADRENAAAQTRLAISLMRCGLENEAAPILEHAWQLDRFNVWLYNLRQLLRQGRKQYETRQTRRFQLRLYKREADILTPYVSRLVEQNLSRCEKIFGYRVPDTIRLSIMHTQAAFAARVTGLPTLHASGATTGSFVALVSPAAFKSMGHPYNWQSTMLHEIAHVVTLMGSRYRIPRWLTEGMSVYMQGRTRDIRDIPFKTMIVQGPLPDLATWNRDFTHPRYSWMIPAAYEAAGLFVTWLVDEYGRQILPRIIRLYADGKKTGQVFHAATGRNLRQLTSWFHGRLRAYAQTVQCRILENPEKMKELEERYTHDPENMLLCLKLLRLYLVFKPKQAVKLAEKLAGRALGRQREGHDVGSGDSAISLACIIAARAALGRDKLRTAKSLLELVEKITPDNAHAQYMLGLIALRTGDHTAAEQHLRNAIREYPRFVSSAATGNPYLVLTKLLLDRGDRQEAARILKSYCDVKADDAKALRRLAGIYVKTGNHKAAIRTYRRIIAIDPYLQGDHIALAKLLAATGQKRDAEMERKVAAACAKLQPERKAAKEPGQGSGTRKQDPPMGESSKTTKGEKPDKKPAVGRELQKFLQGL